MKLLRIACLLLALFVSGCATSPPATRTLFVVPATLPDGRASDAERAELERWLVDRAGGYTELGEVRGGWKSPTGEVVTETNRLYLISVSDKPGLFEKELRERIVRDFHQQEAYVERW